MGNEWQKLIGDGARADGYEEWMTQTMTSHLPQADIDAMTPEYRAKYESRMRIGKIMIAATIECARQEAHVHGQDEINTLTDIVDMMACATAGLVKIVLTDDGARTAPKYLVRIYQEKLRDLLKR